MSNLMEYLFAYAQEHWIEPYLFWEMKSPYKDSRLCAEKQEARLRDVLDQEGTAHLDNFLEEQTILQVAQMRAAFLAGFHMAAQLAR